MDGSPTKRRCWTRREEVEGEGRETGPLRATGEALQTVLLLLFWSSVWFEKREEEEAEEEKRIDGACAACKVNV